MVRGKNIKDNDNDFVVPRCISRLYRVMMAEPKRINGVDKG